MMSKEFHTQRFLKCVDADAICPIYRHCYCMGKPARVKSIIIFVCKYFRSVLIQIKFVLFIDTISAWGELARTKSLIIVELIPDRYWGTWGQKSTLPTIALVSRKCNHVRTLSDCCWELMGGRRYPTQCPRLLSKLQHMPLQRSMVLRARTGPMR